MKKKNILLWVFVVIVAAIVVVIATEYYRMIEVDFSVESKNGVLELESVNLDSQVARIEGEWDFYPMKLYSPEDFADGDRKIEELGISNLSEHTDYGTYRLIVRGAPNKIYSINGFSPNFSMKLYINGIIVAEFGNVTDNKETAVPQTGYIDVPVCTDDNGYAEIICQYTNFWDDNDPGEMSELIISSLHKMEEYRAKQNLSSIFWGGGLIFIGLYYVMSAAVHKRKDYLMLAICCILIGLRDQNLFNVHLLPSSVDWFVKYRLFVIITAMVPGGLCLLINSLNSKYTIIKLRNIYMTFLAICVVIFAFGPINIVDNLCHVSYYVAMIYFVQCIFGVIKHLKEIKIFDTKEKLMLVGYGILVVAVLSELLMTFNVEVIAHHGIISAGMIIFVLLTGIAINLKIHEIELSYEKTKSEEELHQKVNELKMKFFRKMIHEMKTPLTVMSGYAQLTRMQLENNQVDEETYENLEAISSESSRMSNMVVKLLESEQFVADNTFHNKVDVDELTKEALTICKPICEKSGNELNIDIKDRYYVSGNEEMILRIIVNIVSNGARYTSNGKMKIAINEPEDGMVEFILSNNGKPIAENDKQRIFEEGYSVDGNTGLGLAICKELIEGMNGSIYLVKSDAEETAFGFKVPEWRE